MEILAEPSTFHIFIVVFVLLLLLRLTLSGKVPRGLRLPPGPPPKPIVGNAYDMPTTLEYETFTKWGKVYGDLFHVKVFNQRMIFVNSAVVAHDLFEKRSALYSDRFDFPMVNDLMGFDYDFALMHYGERWRRHRKMFHQKFHPNAAVAYHGIQTRLTRQLLRRLHKSPDDFIVHIRHLGGAIIMEVVYGIKVLPKNDPYIQIADKAMRAIGEAANPGSFLVDTLPILKYVPEWMPGAGFRKKARIWREVITKMHVLPFNVAKKAFNSGTLKTCYTSLLLEELSHRTDAPADEEEVICNSAAVAYSAGAESTSTALTWFILAMILYPEVQRKAQSELDAVVQDRLPEFGDREHLPYVDAICKEIYRWHPVAPLGIAHRVTQDDVYGDYFIPGGSIVIGNAWALLHDEKVYGPNTESFEPERFLRDGTPDSTNPAFGFGRRTCPGRHMADNSVFIAVASVLKAFNITHAKDANGNPIAVQIGCLSGSISRPDPFRCAITPRSAAAEALLLEHFDE